MRAFFKKEMLEQLRSGKLLILGIVFVLFGIMNPAIAKLTPWLLETLSDSLAESGMSVTAVTVDAMTSWTQFFKNISMELIIFVLLEGGILVREYQSGTLILALSRGLPRRTVVLTKTLVLSLLWTACYWLCFGITYGYNAYFWDNSVALNLGTAVFNWWLLGLWAAALLVLFSVLGTGTGAALCGTGGGYFAAYLLGLLPKLRELVPTKLADSASLLHGLSDAADYRSAVCVTAALIVLAIAASIPIMNRKQL